MANYIEKHKYNYDLFINSYLLSILVAIIVYLSGGTTKVYTHFMYIPIAWMSSVYGRKQGVISGIFCGLLLGPFMPFYVSQGIMQEPVNWLMRLVIFIIISYIIGYFSDYNKIQNEKVMMILTHNVVTGLKNLEAIKNEEENDMLRRTIIFLHISGISETINIFGYNFRNEIMKSITVKLKEFVNDKVELYHYSELQYVFKIIDSDNETDDNPVIKNIAGLNKTILKVENIPIYIEIQMGIAHIDGRTSTYEGLRRAQIALSNARLSSQKMVVFDHGLDKYYKSVFEVANDFSQSLENHKVGVAYQKVVSASTEEVYTVEMLARWTKDDGTRIRPDFFIPIIEKTELIHELTKYIIRQSITYLSNNESESSMVSINFSLKDFSEESIQYLIDSAKEANIDLERFQIEVIERTLSDVKDLSRYLYMLKEHKIKIALDDFGTGYSSIHYASELPIDVIKVDKSLIMNVNKNSITKNLVESIVKYCNTNNIKTVAEGVETKEIADTCKDIGFDYLQGYYYHKPMTM